jgi:phosphoglucosamine mutase
LFADLEADISTMGTSPNGLNINEGVGSTHPEKLAEIVKEKGCDMGLAFDGDGDRLIAIDEKGNIVDGDQIMFICAKYLKEQGRLKQDTVVSTVMSNLGFYKAVEANEMKSAQTAVGDRYVMEEMRKNDFNLGGEQSGHIIFLDYTTTGDGLLSGIQLASILKATGKPLSELAGEMKKFPQLLINVKVADKSKLSGNDAIKAAIDKVETELEGNGRVLVRPSGTEPLVRVMVEAPTEELCQKHADEIVEVVKAELV